MKALLFSIFLLLSLPIFSQSPYLGGEGDGYARTSISLEAPPTDLEIAIARVEQGASIWFEVRLEGLQSACELEVFDVRGREVMEMRSESTGNVTLVVPTDSWASGPYLFRVTANGEKHLKKALHVRGSD